MKKFLALFLTVALTATAAITGTLAYLQDDASDVNVMTLGNVKIEQHEYQRAEKEDGTYKTGKIDEQTSYVLEAFEQNKPLLPIVGDPSKSGDAYAGWDDTTVRMSQVDSYGGMQVFAGKNAQDKFVTVENTGNNEAYVRTLVAIEVGTANAELIGTSYHSTWKQNGIGIVNINGNNYSVVEYVYAGAQLSDGSWRHENGVLPAGDTTYPNLSQVYLKSEANNEDMVAIDGNGNGTLDILVLSQAVQAEGFENATAALTAGFGEANAANVRTWFGDTVIPEYVSGEVTTTGTGYGYKIDDGETAILNNVNIVTEGGGISVWGTAEFNSGSIVTNSTSTSGRHVFYVTSGEDGTGHLTINDGEFTFSPSNLTRKGYYICAHGEDATVIVNGGNFGKPSTRSDYKAGIGEMDGGKVIIYGGTFAFDPSKWVAEGYESVESNGIWTVSEKTE